MKKIILFAVLAILGMRPSGSAAVSLSPLGPVGFNLTSFQQGLDFVPISVKTNHTATSTNVTTTYKSTVTNSVAKTLDVLNALANSFNTNFPAGAKLAANASSFYVMDPTGTNLLLDVSDVLFFDYKTGVGTGVEADTVTENSTGTHFSSTESSARIYDVTLIYDDHSLTTTDGKHTQIELRGLLLLNRTIKKNVLKSIYTFTGAGSGEVRDTERVIKGVVVGKGSQKFTP